jgi:hypothetical protein
MHPSGGETRLIAGGAAPRAGGRRPGLNVRAKLIELTRTLPAWTVKQIVKENREWAATASPAMKAAVIADTSSYRKGTRGGQAEGSPSTGPAGALGFLSAG